LFTPELIQSINGIAWWAVMLFVWIAGVELDLSQAWAHRRESMLTAGLALGVPLVLGSAAALVLQHIDPGWVGAQGTPSQFVLGVGMACAVTALPILMLFMERLTLLRSAIGQRILRYASLDDIAIWAVLACILVDWERLGKQLLFVFAFVPAGILMRTLMPRLQLSDRWFVALIWLLSSAALADWAGLHFMVGAFLAGVILDVDWFGQAALDHLRHHVLLTLMPVFFLSTGLRTQWELGGWLVAGAAALLLVASVGGKLIGVHLAGRLLGWRRGDASLIGWLLQTKALIMIIFANVLFDKDIITANSFTALLLMAIASTMLTIPIVSRHLRRNPIS
jgi:Kef-type K+ transport system membrane component KefB